jgi:hypothetical protein
LSLIVSSSSLASIYPTCSSSNIIFQPTGMMCRMQTAQFQELSYSIYEKFARLQKCWTAVIADFEWCGQDPKQKQLTIKSWFLVCFKLK